MKVCKDIKGSIHEYWIRTINKQYYINMNDTVDFNVYTKSTDIFRCRSYNGIVGIIIGFEI